jgi:hypothetical protein
VIVVRKNGRVPGGLSCGSSEIHEYCFDAGFDETDAMS